MSFIHEAPEFIIGIIILLVLALYFNSIFMWIFVITLSLSILYFFRSWNGEIIQDPNTIISPADGKILEIRDAGSHFHIAIFLNVNNIHVQYMPISGHIVSQKHIEGTYAAAYLFNKSMFNERVETTIHSPELDNEIKVVQIAGMLARRIKSLTSNGEYLEKGKPFGLIKLGSRVDIYLPKDKIILHPNLHVNDRIKIGDPIAFINNNEYN